MTTRAGALGLIGAGLALAGCGARGNAIAIGSKNFTESLLLGELYAQVLEAGGFEVRRRLDLGGTDIAMAALRRGEIDLYPEYTGTALLVVLKAQPLADPARTFAFVKQQYERRYALDVARSGADEQHPGAGDDRRARGPLRAAHAERRGGKSAATASRCRARIREA